MLDSPLIVVGVALVLGLLAGTFRSIRSNLMGRSAAEFRPGATELFRSIETCMWIFATLAVIVAAPHPNTVVLVLMFWGSVKIANRMRYLEEACSLNQCLQLLGDANVSTIHLIEGIADGCRSQVAMQAKQFVQMVSRGNTVVEAARRSKIPLSPNTLACMMQEKSVDLAGSKGDWDSGSDSVRQDYRSSIQASLNGQQFSYALGLIFLFWAIGFPVRKTLASISDGFLAEFSIDMDDEMGILKSVVQISNGLIAILAIWLFIAAFIRWIPASWVQYVPWFGRRAINQWRCEVLDSLHQGIRMSRPTAQTFSLLEQLTRVRWIRGRCARARRSIERGTTFPMALKQAQIVNERERQWLVLAEQNSHLLDAIARMRDDIERRQAILWQLRATWVLPLAQVCVGLFVFAHVAINILLLSKIIGSMS